MIRPMDTQTIDNEFDKLQTEFQDVAKTVQGLAAKLQAAEKAGDANASEWLADLKQVAQDIDDEQEQVKVLLLAVHGFIGELAAAHTQETAAAATAEKPSLFAAGKDPFSEENEAQQVPQQRPHRGLFAGMLGGGMGGGMLGGGYYGGGFGQAMETGMAMSLGADLVNSIFR
jgi:hypothetical protein